MSSNNWKPILYYVEIRLLSFMGSSGTQVQFLIYFNYQQVLNLQIFEYISIFIYPPSRISTTCEIPIVTLRPYLRSHRRSSMDHEVKYILLLYNIWEFKELLGIPTIILKIIIIIKLLCTRNHKNNTLSTTYTVLQQHSSFVFIIIYSTYISHKYSSIF